MRPGADQRTQVCRGMNCRGIHLESEMVPAYAVLGDKKRGWYCTRCAQAVKDARKKRRAASHGAPLPDQGQLNNNLAPPLLEQLELF